MADSQPLSGAPEGAEYLRAVLRAPVYEAAQVTPLQKMEKLSSRLDNVILVKREDRQPVHSFKLRGAYAMMAGLTEEQKAHGVITASAGNHAQGVAFSSARLGVKALIVMPTATADIKVDAVRGFGDGRGGDAEVGGSGGKAPPFRDAEEGFDPVERPMGDC